MDVLGWVHIGLEPGPILGLAYVPGLDEIRLDDNDKIRLEASFCNSYDHFMTNPEEPLILKEGFYVAESKFNTNLP